MYFFHSFSDLYLIIWFRKSRVCICNWWHSEQTRKHDKIAEFLEEKTKLALQPASKVQWACRYWGGQTTTHQWTRSILWNIVSRETITNWMMKRKRKCKRNTLTYQELYVTVRALVHCCMSLLQGSGGVWGCGDSNKSVSEEKYSMTFHRSRNTPVCSEFFPSVPLRDYSN